MQDRDSDGTWDVSGSDVTDTSVTTAVNGRVY